MNERWIEPKDYGPASKAIRAKCIDCCGDDSYEVRKCNSYDCPLWLYRMGRKIKNLEK